DEDWCSGLYSVTDLDLSQNRLTHLPSYAFRCAKALTKLNLRDNLIETVDTRTFDTVFNLQHLDLSNNKLRQVPSNSYDNLCSVLTLNLAHNLIVSLNPLSLIAFRGLNKLDLSYNQIEIIEPDAFLANHKLVSLSVSFGCVKAATSWIASTNLVDGAKKPGSAIHLPEQLRNLARIEFDSCGMTHVDIDCNLNTSTVAKLVDDSKTDAWTTKTDDDIAQVKQSITHFIH
ncbi:insulin-like growth factor-binding protein complex acid labile subunit, partial [Photinus pyralis]